VRRALLAALLVAAFAVLVGGCGGDDEPSPTKAEFVKQADEICQQGNERADVEAQKYVKQNEFDAPTASTKEVEKAIRSVYLVNVNEQVEELKELGAPEGDEDQVDEIVASYEDGVATIEEKPMTFFDGSALKEPRKLATDYGLETCG
jgi:hypothetical protein